MSRIYLDHAATTPLLPEAHAAMEPWLTQGYGNASSLHQEGRRAKEAIDQAREALSDALGCLFGEVLFTGSGTEAANLALVGAALGNEDSKRNRVLLGAAEHHCVLHTKPLLQRLGYRVEEIPVDREARVDLNALGEMLGEDVLLVSVMHANNETGAFNPVRDIADLAHKHGALFHTDAVQTFPWATVGDTGADLMTVAAHKLYGPKGVGAIYIKGGTSVKPVAIGGGQEREMRAGTENVPGIVGFGEAVRWCLAHPELRDHRRAARAAFAMKLTGSEFEFTLNDLNQGLETHVHGRFPDIDAETMLIRLDRAGISASSGAACSSGSLEPSHVLMATGRTEQEASEGLRFSFGKANTPEQAERAADNLLGLAEEIYARRRA